MPYRFEVRFDSADDSDVDARTTLLEDEPQELDVILETCRRHGIRARLIKDQDIYATIVPGNERRVPFGEQKTKGSDPPA
jgi:hypothetical protein